MILGLDVGGTNIDALIVSNNKIIKTYKKQIKSDLKDEIIFVINKLTNTIDKSLIKQINLSTTVSTNALYLKTLKEVGLIIQSGPGLPNSYLKVNNNTKFIDGYIDHLGRVVKDLNVNEINNIKNEFINDGIKNIAVISKFSNRNNYTEEKVYNILKDDFNHISKSHLITSKLNFIRRIHTTYLNALIYDTYNDFISNLHYAIKELGIKANINILKADGGIMDINYSKERAIETILSGPAASLMGVNYLTNVNEDAIILDIGGSTTDLFFLKDGVSLFEPKGIEIKTHKTLIRAIYSKSLSLGGDSLVSFENDDLKLLNKREGFSISFGGDKLTLTDFLMYNESELSKREIDKLVKEKGKVNELINDYVNNVYEFVNNNLKEINSKVVYTINELINYDKLEPKKLILIGAPAKALSPYLSNKFNLEVIIPTNYEIANAIGAAFSKQTKELSLYINTKTNSLVIPELNIYEKLKKRYTLNQAKDYLLNKLKEELILMGESKENINLEITEEEVYSIVDGFSTLGENIRLKAQVKPGINKKVII